MAETPSLLSYYRGAAFNPLGIDLSDPAKLAAHRAKREHLYQTLLGLPLGWLRGKEVLEVGPASGENALVFAMMGANLTLVEPNEHTRPRIEALFDHFGVRDRIRELSASTIDAFRCDRSFDLVVAEGFVDTLADRERAIARLCELASPGGVVSVTRHEAVGMLAEFVKKAVYARASASLAEEERLAVAESLFAEDYARIPASRGFRTWWKDNLDSPVVNEWLLWPFEEMLAAFHAGGCSYHASHPNYVERDTLRWYKDVPSAEERERAVLDGYVRRAASWVLAGPLFERDDAPIEARREVVSAFRAFVAALARWTRQPVAPAPSPDAIEGLDRRLGLQFAPRAASLVRELTALLATLDAGTRESIVEQYRASSTLRSVWGSHYHYVCFRREA
ncbi:MAG: methyltransferase domain-containing protein [Planctomycetota bacterium]